MKRLITNPSSLSLLSPFSSLESFAWNMLSTAMFSAFILETKTKLVKWFFLWSVCAIFWIRNAVYACSHMIPGVLCYKDSNSWAHSKSDVLLSHLRGWIIHLILLPWNTKYNYFEKNAGWSSPSISLTVLAVLNIILTLAVPWIVSKQKKKGKILMESPCNS